MGMTTETKLLIGVFLATIVIIAGGVWFASRKQVEQTGPVNESERLVRADDPVLGPADAQVTVVEFGDFQCPACGAVHPILKQVKEQNKDKSVRFVYRHYPLPQHEHAQFAAVAAVAAQAQGKFWEMHDKLFENQQKLDRESIEGYAEQLGLNFETFQEAVDGNAAKDAVAADKSDGQAVGVSGTPTIYINAVKYTGQYTVEAMQAAIEAALNKPTS
jgi:protein-disulfide isomerase